MIRYHCYSIAVTTITNVVPDNANFDCSIPRNVTPTKFMLYKDDIKVVTATISLSNGTIEDDSDAFSVFGGLETISFQLEKSSLESEGFYRCVYLSNNTEVTGEEYKLLMFGKLFLSL